MQVKQAKPTLWDAAEEAQAHQAGRKSLCSGLLGDPLTDGGLSQLGWAMRELQVSKASEKRERWHREHTGLRLQREEHRHRSLLAGILQDTVNLAAQNRELRQVAD
ncbi:hypothetical protein MDA_GLEAN10012434 [Myotis davidii]|uniref:Uncharacterized protein n=1 Tax=Myotis davidii TaxID=225400 RepID=L5LDG8_MYODS|nr:hypothetical protein MDA_GLEAN10012434 [Myotis davidii]